jgi:diguanylate cyclase (GGDEF)-like protein/PAS domain S-box-containing protein
MRPLVHRAAAISAAFIAVGAIGALIGSRDVARPGPLFVVGLGLVAVGAVALAVLVPVRSRVVRRQNAEISRQEAILKAAAFAAERFLAPDGLGRGLDESLERVGRATRASRVYVFENSVDARERLLMDMRAEWVAPGVRPAIDEPDNHDYPYSDGFGHWARWMSNGKPVQVKLSDSTGAERKNMEDEEILSIAVVPVFVAGAWWGFLGVDDCVEEREWSSGELDALTVAAATLGAALSRERWLGEIERVEERFRVLVEQAPAVVYIDALDQNASTQYVSPQVEAITGYTAEEWIADPDLWPKVLHPEDREEALRHQAQHNETGEPFRMEYRLIHRDGRELWIRDEAVMICNSDGSFRHSQGIMQDITDAKLASDRIEFLAYHDGLTGLPNQHMFAQLAELALARANRADEAVAVLCVDVDSFKLANDSLGTEGGDELLRQIAERLAVTIRDTDTLARRGADEFVVLLADLERGEVGDMQTPLLFAETVAGRIRDAMSQGFEVKGQDVFVSASVGISVHPDDANGVESLLLHAEHAMRSSKRRGPGGFAAYGEDAMDSAATFAFVTRLRRAVERREWTLVYQPVVELATGAIQGVEALVRWITPDGETISPSEFVPLAEELGLIEQIGDWVLEELVRKESEWRAEGLELEMGFNLSPRQFWQPDLADRILARLDERRVDPRNILVEITETSAMRDPDRAHDVLWDLHSRGLRIALDDFGTGYSSLSRLRNLPVDVLKIDRSFVRDVDRDPQSAKIVAAFIQLGQGLGMTTLAEGIETESEWRFLAEQGCQLGQGYYFSRPVPAAEILERFRAGRSALAST